MAVLHRLRRYKKIPPQEARPNERHPFFRNANVWRLSWLDNMYQQDDARNVILGSRQCEWDATPWGQALRGAQTGTPTGGVRIAYMPGVRHTALWGGVQGGYAYATTGNTDRSYYALAALLGQGGTSVTLGNGGSPSSAARRSYTLDRGGDIYCLRLAATITTAPSVWTDGLSNTATFSSGTASSYGGGYASGTAYYQLSWNLASNSLQNVAVPFYAATDDMSVPDDVLADLSLNPWQLWEPKRIWVPMQFSSSYTLVAETGAFTLTGNTQDLVAQRTIIADAGGYTLTGNDATLTYNANDLTLTAEAGSFALTGNTVGLLAQRVLTAETGSFTLTGNAATFTRVSALSADTGVFTLTGNAAGLLVSRVINADTGSFTFTGNDVNLARALRLPADTGAFSFTGNDANLYKVFLLAAETGAFTLAGNAAALALSRVLTADSGAFTFTGNNAELRLTGGSGSSAADIWGYVLSNGMTAEEALVAVYTALHKEGGVLTVGKFLGLK